MTVSSSLRQALAILLDEREHDPRSGAAIDVLAASTTRAAGLRADGPLRACARCTSLDKSDAAIAAMLRAVAWAVLPSAGVILMLSTYGEKRDMVCADGAPGSTTRFCSAKLFLDARQTIIAIQTDRKTGKTKACTDVTPCFGVHARAEDARVNGHINSCEALPRSTK